MILKTPGGYEPTRSNCRISAAVRFRISGLAQIYVELNIWYDPTFLSLDVVELEKRQQEKERRKEDDQITKEEKVKSNRPPIPKCSPPELKSIN